LIEFVSKLEELIKAEELHFKPTPGFGKTYNKFLGQAIAHPAKMNTQLTEFLIRKFTEEGDVVLDPMAGSGQTGVIAAVHGRDAVCVELEKKFYDWMEQARRKVETQQTLARKGKIRNVLGDARQLSQLLQEADVVVTSPPYSQSINAMHRSSYPREPSEIAKEKNLPRAYSRDEENIGNLKHGKVVDVVVTSPPYSGNTTNKRDADAKLRPNRSYRLCGIHGDEKGQIGNLKHGKVDSIITSPPYAESLANENPQRKEGYWKTSGGYQSKHGIENYGQTEENIGNLRFADCIVTSPPYEKSINRERQEENPEIWNRIKEMSGGSFRQAKGYSADSSNIGNLHKETYLEAMLTVYQQMHSVLKPDGKAIIIIKPFIRNKKVVDLPYQTHLLLKQAGFKLTRLFKLRLKQQSFWRILYHRKFPNVAQIKHEYVLVTIKHGISEV